MGNVMGLDVTGRVAWYPTGTGLTGIQRDEWRPSSPMSVVLFEMQSYTCILPPHDTSLTLLQKPPFQLVLPTSRSQHQVFLLTQASVGDLSGGSSSARSAVASFLERLERDGAAREEGFRQLQLRVRRERDGLRRNPQEAHLSDIKFLRRARVELEQYSWRVYSAC